MIEFVARVGLVVRERHAQFAAPDCGKQSLLLGLAAGVTDEAPAQHDRGEIGFQHQARSKCFHHDHSVDRGAVQTAERLGKGQSEHAELSVLAPRVRAVALRRTHKLAARLEIVLLPDESPQRILQGGLLFAEFEIHGLPHSPRIMRVMMFF